MNSKDVIDPGGCGARTLPLSLSLTPIPTIGERLGRRGAPLKNFLGPVHPQEAVHFPFVDHFHLRRIPQFVVRVAMLQLFSGVDVFTAIWGVFSKCLLRPRVVAILRVQAIKFIVAVRVVEAVVIGQLATDYEFLQERIDVFRAGGVFSCKLFRNQSHSLGTQLAKV